MTLSLELTLSDKAFANLERLVARLEHKGPLMAAIAAYLESSTRDRWRTQTAPDGKKWIPSIRAKKLGGRTLEVHGLLRDSYIGDSGEDFARVGSNDPRAAPLHAGAIIRPKKAKALAFNLPGVGFKMVQKVVLPARPQVGLSKDDAAEVSALTTDYLEGAFEEGDQ